MLKIEDVDLDKAVSEPIPVVHVTTPGHSYFVVGSNVIAALGGPGKFTGYSILRRGKAYLEEDCDIPTFEKLVKEAGRTYVVEKSVCLDGVAPCGHIDVPADDVHEYGFLL